jgi:hypothetical protein
MQSLLQNFKILFGTSIIKTSNNCNYVIFKQLKYNQTGKFLYQYGYMNLLEDYKEEINTYKLDANTQLPLSKTHFTCNTCAKNNTIEKYIKNNSNVRYYYFKIFSKEFIFIRSL